MRINFRNQTTMGCCLAWSDAWNAITVLSCPHCVSTVTAISVNAYWTEIHWRDPQKQRTRGLLSPSTSIVTVAFVSSGPQVFVAIFFRVKLVCGAAMPRKWANVWQGSGKAGNRHHRRLHWRPCTCSSNQLLCKGEHYNATSFHDTFANCYSLLKTSCSLFPQVGPPLSILTLVLTALCLRASKIIMQTDIDPTIHLFAWCHPRR